VRLSFGWNNDAIAGCWKGERVNERLSSGGREKVDQDMVLERAKESRQERSGGRPKSAPRAGQGRDGQRTKAQPFSTGKRNEGGSCTSHLQFRRSFGGGGQSGAEACFQTGQRATKWASR